MTKIILVRHCQAEGNEKRFFQGIINTDVTEKGKKQINATAEFLKGEKIDVFYSSPLNRAVTTAKGIASVHNYAPEDIILRDALKEIDAGVWDGMYLTEIAEKYPEDDYNWDNRPEIFCPQDSEGMQSVYDRVWKELCSIVNENSGKTVCIISHGCAIRNMLCHIHQKPITELKTIPWGTNCAVSIIEFDNNMKANILLENSVQHLMNI